MPNLKKSGQQPTGKLHVALKRVSVKQLNLKKKYAFVMCILALLLTSGCVTNQYSNPGQVSSTDRVVGVGYAVINAQEGNSPEEKRLMAIKVSKLEAYRSLAEQLYGQYIESRGTLSNLKMGQEELVSRVEGLIVGARVVSIKPISTDSYQTVMEMGQPEALRRPRALPAVTPEEDATEGGSLTGDLSFVGSGFFKKTVD